MKQLLLLLIKLERRLAANAAAAAVAAGGDDCSSQCWGIGGSHIWTTAAAVALLTLDANSDGDGAEIFGGFCVKLFNSKLSTHFSETRANFSFFFLLSFCCGYSLF